MTLKLRSQVVAQIPHSGEAVRGIGTFLFLMCMGLSACSDLPVTTANFDEAQALAPSLAFFGLRGQSQSATNCEIEGFVGASLAATPRPDESRLRMGSQGLFLHLRVQALTSNRRARFVWQQPESGRSHHERGWIFAGDTIGAVSRLPSALAHPGRWVVEVHLDPDNDADASPAYRREFSLIAD